MVTIALVASWFVAVIFTPIVGGFLLKPPKPAELREAAGGHHPRLHALARFAIRVPWLMIARGGGAFVLSVIALPRVDQQFFPASDRNELIVDLQLPRSSSIFASEDAVERIEEWLATSEDVDFWSAYIGRNVIRFYLPLAIRVAHRPPRRRSWSWPPTSTRASGWRRRSTAS